MRGTGRLSQAKQLGAAQAWRSVRRAWRCLDECALLLPHKFLQGSACRGAGGAGGAAHARLSLPSPDWPGLACLSPLQGHLNIEGHGNWYPSSFGRALQGMENRIPPKQRFIPSNIFIFLLPCGVCLQLGMAWKNFLKSDS